MMIAEKLELVVRRICRGSLVNSHRRRRSQTLPKTMPFLTERKPVRLSPRSPTSELRLLLAYGNWRRR